jgi:hypothetical protein
MTDKNDLNERGNHQGQFSQGVGGWAEYTVHMTEVSDPIRHDVKVPSGKVIPIIFLPGVMGSNLRMTKARQEEIDRPDSRAWRPDDMVTTTAEIGVAAHGGIGGWFRDATPAQRQLVFDPNETEVEYYHYTESQGRFDPEGTETLAADARHQNVPDSLEAIPPLLGQRQPTGRGFSSTPSAKKRETPAQVARWRGWSEVLFAGAYGQMLKTAERYMNNMTRDKQLDPIWSPLLVAPSAFGAQAGDAISVSDLKKVSKCWYPVHAIGYNFLQSNGKSAVAIAKRIRGLVKGYQDRGFGCNEVIIVTHSMGGLVARALIHPRYGNLLNDNAVKVLGIYHNVMPTMGAAAAYKRMRFGFQEKDGYSAGVEASILGIDGENATAILANTPAPLELLPFPGYGNDWIKVQDGSGKVLWTSPSGNGGVLASIYLQPEKAWWRLINPKWVNPANVSEKRGGGISNTHKRLIDAFSFMRDIEQTFHPVCYASFCSSQEHSSYGEIIFRLSTSKWTLSLPPPETWELFGEDGKGKLTVKTGEHLDDLMELQLQPPSAPGDETVPAVRSAEKIRGFLFLHGTKKDEGYEHQKSYGDAQVLNSMLYSLVQIAKTAKWE